MSKKSKGKKGRAKKDLKEAGQKPARKKAKKPAPAPSPPKPKGEGIRGVLARLPAWYPLVLFMLIGLLFRLSVTLWEPILYPDSLQYMHLAQEIKSGAFFGEDFELDEGFLKSRRLPPLYPFLLAPFAGTDIDLEYAGTVISLFMAALTFVPLYFFASMAFSRRIASISCALLCFHTFTLRYSSPLLTEATFAALFVGLLALSAYCFMRPSFWLFAVCGVLSSLLYMTRDVGITAVFLIAAGAVVKLGIMDRHPKRRLVGYLAILFVSFLFMSAPYFAHIRARTGHWGLTVQMSNTSITRQIQLFGGDRYDRDRLEGWEIGTRLLGDEPARHAFDLIRIAPALLKKTVVNMGLYGLEMVQRWGVLVFPLIVIGVMGMIRDYLKSRDRLGLFMGAWVAVWIVQLWALYSLITPYMVDDRYIFPLMATGLILAGRGVLTLSDWFQDNLWGGFETGSEGSSYLQALALPAALVLYLSVIHHCVEPDALINYGFDHPTHLIYIYPLFGLIVLFAAALVPGLRLALPPRFLGEGQGLSKSIVPLALILAGSIALLIPSSLKPPLTRYLPGLVLVGAGLGLAFFHPSMRQFVQAKSFTSAISVFLVVFTFFVQWPDFYELLVRMSSETLHAKYAAGYKQAAAEIKARGLIPPGKVICSRKPFIAYYLDGKWYKDEESKEPVPKRIDELVELVQSGSIDYLAGDNFTFKYLRPLLTEVVYGLEPLPGARIIYSSTFTSLDRIITVYDCHHPEPPLPDRSSAKAHVSAANYYLNAGHLPFAFREAKRAMELDPNNHEARAVMFEILRLCCLLSEREKIPTHIIAPNVYSSLIKVGEEFVRLAPNDPRSSVIIEEITRIREREEWIVNTYSPQLEGL